MTRDVHASSQAELAAVFKRPVLFYEGEFAGSQFLRLWSGVGEKTWDSKTWTGAGNLLGCSEIKETAGTVAESVTVSLSGMPSELIALVHLHAQHGLPGSVWLGFLNAAEAVVADPYLAFKGRLDVPDIVDNGDDCVISITYEGFLVDLKRPRVFRWDHETQQIFHPGDRGFEYVAALQDQVLEW